MTISMNTSSIARCLILAVVLLVGSSSAQAQLTVSHQLPPGSEQAKHKEFEGPLYSARDVTLKIEVRRATILSGDSIDVRLTLINQSAHLLKYTAGTAVARADLRVLDAKGREVKRTLPPTMIFAGGSLDSLTPHGMKTLVSAKGKEWMNLRDWAYDIREPGTYTIVGIPGVTGARLRPDSSVRSNRVEITLTK